MITGLNGKHKTRSQWPEKNDRDILYSLCREKLHLTKAAEVDFTGFDALEFALQPQFWEFMSDTKARFKGETGEYDLIYDATNELLYVEQPEKEYPDALYLIGANLGHPGAGRVISATWNLDTPDNGMTCCRVSDNVFEISIYLAENFGFKLFRHHGWGTHPEIEIWAQDLTLDKPTLVQGLSSGDFVAGPLFQSGIYRLTIDMGTRTFSMQPQSG